MAWHKASIPVCAVGAGGSDSVSSGSRSASSGYRYGLFMPSFFLRFFRTKTAVKVTSLPVPAVVGIMILGSPALGTLFRPR